MRTAQFILFVIVTSMKIGIVYCDDYVFTREKAEIRARTRIRGQYENANGQAGVSTQWRDNLELVPELYGSDEEKCSEYCELFRKAVGRCPAASSSSSVPRSIETCVEKCLSASFRKDGTKQDFMLEDTLQCRNNHALMAIKEGALSNTNHCKHADFEGTGRCIVDAESLDLADQLAQGRFVFYNDAIANAVPSVRFGQFVVALRYLLAKRGRLYAAYPYLDVRGGSATDSNEQCSSKIKYRTPDGTCNNIEMPLMGSKGTPFVRNLEASSPHSRGYADARKVSEMLKRGVATDGYSDHHSKAAPFNQLVSAWIQFMTHDWFVHDFTEKGSALHNKVTHWWDASQIYGSTPEELDSVRVDGGKIHLDDNDEIDYVGNTPLTGFSENFWVGLHVMHTIFAREHNHIVDSLGEIYDISDDDKFGVARLCVSAILAKIHTLEWTPTLLDNTISTFGLNVNWYGLVSGLSAIFPSDVLQGFLPQLNSVKSPHFGSSEFGTEQTLHNTSFFMTEEFVSVYRMHPLLPDYLEIEQATFKLSEFVFKDARKLVKGKTTMTLLKALAKTPARTLSLENYPRELYNLTVPGRKNPINLAEIEIIRDRERNIPRYNDARRQLLLEPYHSIDDLTDDTHEREMLKSVYSDIDQVDFMVGCLVDKERPQGFAFGVVPYFIFLVMASRRIFSDRFFQEGFTAEHYTEWGIDYVHMTNFSSILIRHFPELGNDIPKNPFSNW